MTIKNEELIGKMLNYIDFSMEGTLRNKLIEIFVNELNIFIDKEDLRKFLNNLKRENLITSKVINKKTIYFMTQKGKEYLNKKGYLDLNLKRKERRNSLICEMMDFNEDGSLIESIENVKKHFLIQQILLREFQKKEVSLEELDERTINMYKKASIDDFQNEMDYLLKKYSMGLIE